MKRREFVRFLTYSACAAEGMLAQSPLELAFSSAYAGTAKTLVVLFQRGGSDGLNTVVPYGEDAYYSLRGDIAIAPPASGNPDAAINLDGFFGLHPALADLVSIFDSGDLAILPAVQINDAVRSHFDAQDFLESGALERGLDGWLNRYLSSRPNDAVLRAVSFGGSVSHMLTGAAPVSVLSDLRDFQLGLHPDDEARLVNRLASIYEQDPSTTKPYGELLHDTGRLLWRDYQVVSERLLEDYTPATGAAYPDSGLGRQLMQAAQLIKAGLGVEVIDVSSGGWDTHKAQGGAQGRQASRLRDLGQAIRAFYVDLGPAMRDVLLLTMTEFGRTAAENSSGGTDHGHACTWIAAGQSVNGGIHLGPNGWPGLDSGHLVGGRYLAHTIDFRDVLGEVLIRHLGTSSASDIAKATQILRGHVPSAVNFL